MKFTSAVSKLERNGWKIERRNHSPSKATKDSFYILLYTDPLCEEVEEVRYGMDGRAAKKALNLTAAMKLIGDIPTKKYETNPYAIKVPSPQNICRQFVDFEDSIRSLTAFPAHYLKSLNISCKKEVYDLFDETFKNELAPRKRYSHTRDKLIDLISKKKDLMWNALVDLFVQENPNVQPLRLVEIKTKVLGFDDINTGYGYMNVNVQRAIAGIFSFSKEDACRTVRLMLGDFAVVTGGDVVAIGPHNKAFEAFSKIYAVSAQAQELLNLKSAQNDYLRKEAELKKAKRYIEMQEKKIETAQFIDSIAMLSSMNSSDALNFNAKKE